MPVFSDLQIWDDLSTIYPKLCKQPSYHSQVASQAFLFNPISCPGILSNKIVQGVELTPPVSWELLDQPPKFEFRQKT